MKYSHTLLVMVLLVSVQSIFSMGGRPAGAPPRDKDTIFLERIETAPDYQYPLRVLQSLVTKGANVNAVDENGYDAVSLLVSRWAASENKNNPESLEQVLNFLVKNGVDVNKRNSLHDFSITPLLTLIIIPSRDLDEIAKLKVLPSLIKYGADVTLATQVNKPLIEKFYQKKWEELSEDDLKQINRLDNLIPVNAAQNKSYYKIANYLEKFNKGLESFLNNPTTFESIKIGNTILPRSFFEQHMENALKSKNYNQERIDQYLKQRKKLLKRAEEKELTDVLIFTTE